MKKIMLFIEGTTFKTKPILFLFAKRGYAPIGKAKDIINDLYNRGNEIYLCSYARSARHDFIKKIMDYYGVKYTKILCRNKNEQYRDLVERIKPDVLIEDDCKSIGGVKKTCIANVDEKLKKSIRSIIVKEFEGIDGLENDV